jgi:uncharacterized protein DUF4349
MRLREDETLSPEIERELEALDAALAGRPVDAEHDAIAELARELRAERPAPPPDYAAELDARAAEGFPRPASTGRLARLRERLVSTPPHRYLAPAGALATLLVVGGVALSQSGIAGGGGEQAVAPTEPQIEPGGAPTEEQAPPAGAAEQLPPSGTSRGEPAPQPGSVQPPGQPSPDRQGLVPGQDDRKVERAAQLTLSTEPDAVPDVADDVIGVADRYGGIVVSSQVTGTGGDRSVANFDLAIPATRLQDALADLSELADVSARSESTLDITEPFVSARERLTDARAELQSLLAQLADADTPRETASIRQRIEIVRSEIAQARGQLEDLARRARFARISVTVEGSGGSGGWSLGDAVDDALDVLRTVAGVTLVSLAVLAPLGLLIGIGWLIARGTARRSRERALD